MRRRMCVRFVAVCLLTPCLAGWNGSARSDGGSAAGWTAGTGEAVEARGRAGWDAVASVVRRHEAHVVVTLELPKARGDAVLGLRITASARGAHIELPHPGVLVTYTEYDADGRLVFEAVPEAVVGTLSAPGTSRADLALRLAIELTDQVDPTQWRRVEGLAVDIDPVDPVSYSERDVAAPAVVVVAPPSDGCDGDDWGGGSSTSTAGGDGCEGDGFDSGGSGAQGCEGDDLGSSSSSGCGGCEGDAIAAAPGARCVRRSAWVLRAINWTPWLLVFLAIRLLRQPGSSRRRSPSSSSAANADASSSPVWAPAAE